MIKIGKFTYPINDNLLKWELFKYLIEENKNKEDIVIEDRHLEVFTFIYDDKIQEYIINLLSLDVDESIDKIEDIHSSLCYFGNQKYIIIFYETIYKALLKREKKKIENLFEEHIDLVDWEQICMNTAISEKFFEKYIHKVVWSQICINRNISEAFFERHLDKVNWEELSKNPNLSEEFFKKYIHLVNWDSLCINVGLSDAFFEMFINKINWDILSLNYNISEEFFEKHLNKVNWAQLSKNVGMSERFFKKHITRVNVCELVLNIRVGEKLLKRLGSDEADMKKLIRYSPNISESYIEKDMENLCWYSLCKYTNLSDAFYEKYLDQLKWMSLAQNDNISVKFLMKHLDQVPVESIVWREDLTLEYAEILIQKKYPMLFSNNFSKTIFKNLTDMQMFTFDKQWKKFNILDKRHVLI